MSPSFYLAPRYREVDRFTYDQFAGISGGFGGTTETLTSPPTWGAGLSFEGGTNGRAPIMGDVIVVNAQGRLDCFTARGRFFVLAES